MAALAVLSVATSAGQLAEYSISIVSFLAQIHNRLQDAPRQYREYEEQLQVLINTARSIEQNPALQVADIQSHLEATLVDVRVLQSLICSPAVGSINSSPKHKYWNAVTGIEERKISAHLESLHQKNIGLLLSISTVNTTQLSSVQGSVDKLIDMSRQATSHNAAANSARQRLAREAQALEVSDSTALVVAEKQEYPPTTSRQAETSVSRNRGNYYGNITIGANSKVTSGDIFGNTGNGGPAPNKTFLGGGHTYRHITIGPNSIIHQGTTGVGIPKGHTYEDVSIGEDCKVINGDFADLETRARIMGLKEY